jgi:hypothetical protein
MISPNKIIYILCPANLASGGPEALHQLRYYMEQLKLDAHMVYFNTRQGLNPTPERYRIYEPKVKSLDEIIDTKSNMLIAPESSSIMLNGYKNIRKYIWWLGVQYYDNHPRKKLKIIKWEVKYLLGISKRTPDRFDFKRTDCVNVCGSRYAFDYVRKLGIRDGKYLVEPISKEFLDSGIVHISDERDDVILYNPSKPSDIMTRLLECGEFKFKPLKGYSPYELVDVYKKAKLYIDFGYFGGPERMPKEAVFFGCNILVGKRNAAKNAFDVAIQSKYKIKKYNDLDLVKKKIWDMLNNYENESVDFDPFRDKVKNLEMNFVKQIEDVFIR